MTYTEFRVVTAGGHSWSKHGTLEAAQAEVARWAEREPGLEIEQRNVSEWERANSLDNDTAVL